MAVKERKQITGTTAQINAYKGHEGQIVWDKEKKTLVGMSGTAGKNYPLATKTYVDNEVAKVNTEVQKTNAEVAKKQPKGDYATNAKLTEGLAGKEDKGVCLPKTGGLLSGKINLDPNVGNGSIDIGYNYGEKLGSGIGFRSINHTQEPGEFYIYAQDSTKASALAGKPDGTLTWAESEVVRIGKKRVQNFSIGASATRYTAPFTGKCVVSGPPTKGVCNVELINEATGDQMSASCNEGYGWVRGWVLARKGDPVNIIYYSWKPKEAKWVEF